MAVRGYRVVVCQHVSGLGCFSVRRIIFCFTIDHFTIGLPKYNVPRIQERY